jgi:hypothetical protein
LNIFGEEWRFRDGFVRRGRGSGRMLAVMGPRCRSGREESTQGKGWGAEAKLAAHEQAAPDRIWACQVRQAAAPFIPGHHDFPENRWRAASQMAGGGMAMPELPKRRQGNLDASPGAV